MFYKKEEVDIVLLCPICFEDFKDNDPRNLPCGESACHRCIQSRSNSENHFDCSFCEKKHEPSSSEGFPQNFSILILMKTKAGQVYRNAKVDKLRLKLAELKLKSDELKNDFESSTDQIHDDYRVFYSFSRTLKSYKKIIYDRLVTVDSLF